MNEGIEGAATWLVVGLGNPGRKYEGTYHNMGRIAAVELARGREGFDGRWAEKFKGELCRVDVGDARVFVLLPETYMNLSGEAVTKAAGMYKIPVRSIIVVHDDLDLEPGEVRVKDGGGAGGHRGLESCVLSMGSADFLRVRIGIGRHELMDSSDYVLSRISEEHMEAMREAAKKAGTAIEMIIKKGTQHTMNRFNRRKKKKKTGTQEGGEEEDSGGGGTDGTALE